MQDVSKVVIIGSGPAGLTAGIYCSRAGLDPVLYMGTKYGGQLMVTSDVENFPGYKDPIMGPDLMEQMRAQAERVGTKLIQDDVTEVDFRTYPFVIKTPNEERRAMSVIVASGANPRRLNLESEMRLMGKGVSNCAVCDGFFFRGKKLAVVGGGDTAMEEATYLSKLASSVTVIHRRESLRACSRLQEEAFEDPKIEFLFDSAVTEVLGEKRVEGLKVKNVKTGEEKTMQFDGLFVAIGYDPNTEVFRGQLDLDKNGYVVVKNETETNIPGVFVAGDVRDFRYRQAVTAAADGCKAALDADRFLKEPHQVSLLQA
ncbi:MAG: thioredoxin-disulfide reductase [Thaumarchaeota archaeon]|nr:thioredoxin-disulfide reductase [Nitrososphaerota archaeon]